MPGPISAREAALKALREVDEKGAYANLALEGVLERHPMEPRERALATELVYGTSRRRNTLDWAIDRFASRPVAQTTVWIRNILRMGAYQLLYLDKIPVSAACNEAVELAKRYGHGGTVKFVNGVLRALARSAATLHFPDSNQDLVGHLALRHSHPAWMVERWLKRYGLDETVALLEANNNTPPITLRANRLRTNRDGLRQALEAEGVESHETNLSPDGLTIKGVGSLTRLKAYQDGLFAVQDESSMLVAPVVAPKPGQVVIDLASAPGGKATHLAELMGNQGKIIAVDVHEHRLDLVKENCRRLGVEIVGTVTADAREVGELFAGQADAILVDAPCSGLGVLARRPDARWKKDPADIPGLVALQQEILESAARCLKPGGTLVYSTCTIEPDENQGVVGEFLGRHSEFEPVDLWPYLPVGLWRENTLSKGYVQLMPHIHGTDGFFIARLRKRDDRG